MKIHIPTPAKKIIRLQIHRQGEPYEHLNLCECKFEQVLKHVIKVIESQNLSVFAQGYKTKVSIREVVGEKYGKTKSVSFKGLSAKETLEIIKSSIIP